MHVLVVDDEKNARETIVQMLKLYCPEIQTIKEATSVKTARDTIKRTKLDLLLLDIQLEDGNGFDILKNIDLENLSIIFITAYDQYAIKAFKVSAIDYILKPVDPDELAAAIELAHKKIAKDLLANRIDFFLEQIETRSSTIKKIILKTVERTHFVLISDIIYCEADRNYTTFLLENGQKIIMSKNLREYEELLPNTIFLRPHQSYLINTNYITEYIKGDKNAFILTNGHEIPISMRRRDIVLNYLKKF